MNASPSQQHDDDRCLGCLACASRIKEALSCKVASDSSADDVTFGARIKSIHPSTWTAIILFVTTMCLVSFIVVLLSKQAQTDSEDITLKCLAYLKYVSQFALSNQTNVRKIHEVDE